MRSKIKKHIYWFVLFFIFLIFCLAGSIFIITILTPSHYDYQIHKTTESASDEEGKKGMYYVYGGAHGLPFCDAPSPYSKIIDVIPNKTKVKIVSGLKRGYYKIKYNGEEGYVKSRYLLDVDQKVSQETKRSLMKDYPLYSVVSQTDTVSLYKNKNTASKVLVKITVGYRVRLLDKAQNGYCRVSYKNQIGYIEAKYLKQSNQS